MTRRALQGPGAARAHSSRRVVVVKPARLRRRSQGGLTRPLTAELRATLITIAKAPVRVQVLVADVVVRFTQAFNPLCRVVMRPSSTWADEGRACAHLTITSAGRAEINRWAKRRQERMAQMSGSPSDFLAASQARQMAYFEWSSSFRARLRESGGWAISSFQGPR